jgi:hypothetical protein
MSSIDKYFTVFFDEAGNTGSNITNSDQPYFVLSSVCFTEDELAQIRKDIAFDDELHFVRIKNMWNGRGAIRRLLTNPLFDENHITFQIVDKTFATYAFMVDMLIEPFFKYRLNENLYKGRSNVILANCLYSFAENSSKGDATIKAYVLDLKKGFEAMMREQTQESIESFYEIVNILCSMTTKGFQDILSWMLPSQDMLEIVLTEDKKYCLDITLSSLLVLTDHWHKKLNGKIDVVTDNSKQLYANRDLINQLIAIDGYQSVGYDTRKATFPPQIHNVSFVDSKANYGVQIADLVASMVAFAYTGTKGLEKFQEEIKSSKLFQIPCYPLMPATAEYLSQEVDTSNDSDPLDFIVEKLAGKE